jgi:DNA-binding transcriptional MerR regulator
MERHQDEGRETLTIAEIVERTEPTKDTLRWYERQGLIPPVGRTASGYRAYDDAIVRMIELIVRLRRTTMPVGEMKDFVTLVPLGATTHGRRLELLETRRARVLAQLNQLHDDLAAIDAIDSKIAHYADLIAAGQHCAGEPIDDPDTLDRQRSRTRPFPPSTWPPT